MIHDCGFTIDMDKGTAERSGKVYSKSDLCDFHDVYERMCTADTIKDFHPRMSYNTCWNKAIIVRALMADRHISESDALCELDLITAK